MLLDIEPRLQVPKHLATGHLIVKGPTDLDWTAIAAQVKKRAANVITVYRYDDVAINLDEIAQLHGDDELERKAWAKHVTLSPSADAQARAILLLRRIEADRSGAYDPRLVEAQKIASALERVWRARLGKPAFDAWLADHAKAKTSTADLLKSLRAPSHRLLDHFEFPAQQKLVRWYKSAELAFVRLQALIDEVKPQIQKHARAAYDKAEHAKAFRELERRLDELSKLSATIATHNV